MQKLYHLSRKNGSDQKRHARKIPVCASLSLSSKLLLSLLPTSQQSKRRSNELLARISIKQETRLKHSPNLCSTSARTGKYWSELYFKAASSFWLAGIRSFFHTASKRDWREGGALQPPPGWLDAPREVLDLSSVAAPPVVDLGETQSRLCSLQGILSSFDESVTHSVK